MTATTPTTLETYNCPPWCVRWDHHADLVDEQHRPRHYGPDFGILFAEAVGDGTPCVSITEPITFIGPVCAAGLRKVAADALAAAEWLEAQKVSA